jgi:hypothetical protein
MKQVWFTIGMGLQSTVLDWLTSLTYDKENIFDDTTLPITSRKKNRFDSAVEIAAATNQSRLEQM